MPKRKDIHKILVIGSGPIVIGQGAEFDYAGTQACLALKEEGYEVVLCNSNPATIMTDKMIADKIYMEPLTIEFVAKIMRKERPDALIPNLGGQTGLNLAIQLHKKGVLKECRTQLLGTSVESIELAENRELFRKLCKNVGEPILPSEVAMSLEEGKRIALKIGYPVVLRPAFTLGGTGGGFANNETELVELMKTGLEVSPVHQILIEKSVKGYKEIEYEVIRDSNNTTITICNMENMDPVGIHTGDSIVACPSQTLTNNEYQMLRNSALKMIRSLKIEGGCNVQFALDPKSHQYYIIEVNPRVSRSSALASKASGYPIARVSAKISVGMLLDEIKLVNTPAAFEPSLDYVIIKIPRFPFDKFQEANDMLGTQMKATGETMAVGRTFEESLLKAIRSLETSHNHLYDSKFENDSPEQLYTYCINNKYDRIFAIAKLLRLGESVSTIHEKTMIDCFFLDKIKNIISFENRLRNNVFHLDYLYHAKKMGFSDDCIAQLWNTTESKIYEIRKKYNIFPVYKMIDICAHEFDSYVPYFYSTYEDYNESIVSHKEKIIVLGSGPIRIGQGVEFDYSTVHTIATIKKMGYEAIVINNNPETVSTDYTTSDKLYFEPLCLEDVMNIVHLEKPKGVIVTLGGQTAVNLAKGLTDRGVHLIGTDFAAIKCAENRDSFEKLLTSLDIPQPKGSAVINLIQAKEVARKIGYPILVRPSFVLGGKSMQIIANDRQLEAYFKMNTIINVDSPLLIDHYICGKEIEVDAICDGNDVFIPGIMELIERTGIHSGDSMSVYPTFSISQNVKKTIIDYTKRLGIGIGIIGLYNIQFIVDQNENVYIIEVNPRSSRTVPFLSKATSYPLADIATKVSLGISLKKQNIVDIYPREKEMYYVKSPVFSFSKLKGMDTYLSPEMKSTGEVIGYDNKLHRALYKSIVATGMKLSNYGTIIMTLADEDKEEAFPLVKRIYDLGFHIEATKGTANYLKSRGIKTRVLGKLSEGSNEILESIKAGYVTYVVNTRSIYSGIHNEDGVAIRQCAQMNNITTLTSLDTFKVLLDVLEEMNVNVSPI